MTKPLLGLGLLTLALGCSVQPCQSANLSVSPISIELVAPATGAVITLHNRDSRALNAQVRVFRWSQQQGEDQLQPTSAVVASPPILQIGPNGDYVVRLQRATAAEPAGEEAYRVVVDELPDPNRHRNGMINVVLRYILPAFVANPDSGQPRLHWRLESQGGHQVLTAENSGDRHIQVQNLRVKARNRWASVAPGLSGYVLGHSTKAWVLPRSLSAITPTAVSATSDHGGINASLLP